MNKILKTTPLLLVLVLFVSTAPIYAANDADKIGTHIDDVKDTYTLNQGDNLTIHAQLWTDHRYFFRDQPLWNKKLKFEIKDSNGDIVAHKTTETNIRGNAKVKFDTTNFEPGTYTITVKYPGGSHKPSSTSATLIVNKK